MGGTDEPVKVRLSASYGRKKRTLTSQRQWSLLGTAGRHPNAHTFPYETANGNRELRGLYSVLTSAGAALLRHASQSVTIGAKPRPHRSCIVGSGGCGGARPRATVRLVSETIPLVAPSTSAAKRTLPPCPCDGPSLAKWDRC